MRILTVCLTCLFLLIALPVAISAAQFWFSERNGDFRARDRSSAGLLPPASENRAATVRIFAARTVRWRGIFAVHSWIVVKDEGASDYERYDYTAWGNPVRVNGFAADGRWFGEEPQLIFATDGERAARLSPQIRAAIKNYRFRNHGDYRAWPGPNSNTFVAAVLDAVPEIDAVLPPTAIGKDYPHDGNWLRRTPGNGWRISLDGYVGVTLGRLEGFELNLGGGIIGIDVRNPALKLPGLGRIGMNPG